MSERPDNAYQQLVSNYGVLLADYTALQEEVDKLKDIQVLLGECARYISDEIYYSNSAKAHVGSKHRHRLQILKQIELSTEPKEKDDE